MFCAPEPALERRADNAGVNVSLRDVGFAGVIESRADPLDSRGEDDASPRGECDTRRDWFASAFICPEINSWTISTDLLKKATTYLI